MKKSLFAISIILFGLLLVIVSAVVTPARASVSAQSELVERGKYIVNIAGCNDCHTNFKPEYFVDPSKWTGEQVMAVAFSAKDALDEKNMYMAGGRLFDLGPGGKVFTANLTSDVETGLGGWTDEQIKVAIRTGQRPSGRMLVPVMPYGNYNAMADADLDAVVAYLRTLPAIKNKVAEPTFSTENFKPLPYTQGVVAPATTDKAGRGEYLLKAITGCTDCHTPFDPATGAPMMDKYLGGGQPYVGPWGTVYGGNITQDVATGIGSWTEQEIKVAILTGVNNKGRRLILMPWFVYRNLTNDDADALAYYLKNKLGAVKNEVPAASFNEGFNVLAPKTETAASAFPIIPVVVGVLFLIVVILAIVLFVSRKKTAA